VRVILRRAVRPDDPDEGEAVQVISERARTSTRTIYRILSLDSQELSLDLADRVVLAADGHLHECRLVMPDGRVVPYGD
jgi:hypothetical protein